jgi:hypothetical protein
MRRILVLCIVIPYAVVMWPRWAVRDFAAAFREEYRRRS